MNAIYYTVISWSENQKGVKILRGIKVALKAMTLDLEENQPEKKLTEE